MKRFAKAINTNSTNSFILIIKGSIISIIITIIALIIFSLILAYTNIPENTVTPVIIGIAGISILIGSILSSTKIKKRGLINGGAVGLIYVTLIYLLSSIIDKDFSLDLSSTIMCIICIITGIIRRNHRSKYKTQKITCFFFTLVLKYYTLMK